MFSKHLCISTERQCDASESIPDFANVTCSKSNAVGSECNAVCDHGYILEGDTKRTCQENGMWSGTPAQCKRKHISYYLNKSAPCLCVLL